VLAFEPDPVNVTRLNQNMDRNGIENVHVFSVACAAHDGEVDLHLGRDAAYNSVGSVNSRQQTGRQLRVASARLDRIWEDSGSPAVSVMKLDVEGEELEVLKGATGLLTQCKPLLMIEAIDADHYERMHDWLVVRGYHPIRSMGFMPWNYLFAPGSAD
jgi:FkbM family methyltransferase